ncbi:L-rhamnose/proton symporter RhaT [Parapedobacter indicus]|uniref:L-rhamnose-H+ transport protein n=1 Tax=Parapedobacter indicus TaxID=1477437 RepID=A0A1I3DKX1_9SPHI|nr:L-rhamnose/proton symporter RhaT [Parapedobacter indicus]PPL04734.1 L-rhamnose-H+ transport protein [Parapedobacter indicus]SFH87323.1 L-rhamnose-H+ transport protein [Parapedobacter indicus]
MEQLIGIIYHSIGGFSSASFYVPYSKVQKWAWGTYWIVLGFIAWMVMPTIGGMLTTDDPFAILGAVTLNSKLWTYGYGFLWGFGGLLSGLGLRYLGLSLGQSVSLGVSAIVGTLVPAIMGGKFHLLFTTYSGSIILLGFLICIVGIALCGYAGILKDRKLTTDQKQASVKEFSAFKGFAMAIAGGIFSACMALAIHAGSSIAEAAASFGTANVFVNIPIFILALAGGFSSNLIYNVISSVKNRTYGDYVMNPRSTLFRNYFLALLSGIMWYCQFFFYGMGATKMGDYEFASWSIHMSSIIIFSNLWGLYLKEWKLVDKKTFICLWIGILLLITSVLVIGWGNFVSD